MATNKFLGITAVVFCFYSTAFGMRCFIQHIENNTPQQINLSQKFEGETERLLSVDALSTMILPPEQGIDLPYSISKYTRKTTQLRHIIADHDDPTEIVYDLYYTVRVLGENSSIIIYLNSDCLTIEISSSQLFGMEKIPALTIPLKLIINETLKFKLEQLSTIAPSTDNGSSADS